MSDEDRAAAVTPYERPLRVSRRYEAIGAMIAVFNSVERNLRGLIDALVDSGGILVEGERAGTIVLAARRVLDRHWQSVPAKRRTPSRPSRLPVNDDYMHDLLDQVENLERKRNEIVHADWLPTQTGTLRGWRTTRSKSAPLESPTSIEEIVALTQEMMDAALDLFAVAWNIRATESGMDPIPYRPVDEHSEF